MSETKITRKEFLKRSAFGVFSIAAFSLFKGVQVEAASVSDNLGGNGGGTHIGSTAPTNKNKTWIDTGNSGVHKYWNGTTWIPVRSTWDT